MLEHEDSIGPHGIPWEEALDPENDGWFEVEERTDFAQAALDRWLEDHKDREPGSRLVVVSTRAAGNGAQGGDEPPHGAADDADEGA